MKEEVEGGQKRASMASARFVLVARKPDPAVLLDALGPLSAAGLRHVEVTIDTEGAYEIIKEISKSFPQVMVGAGTVLTEAEVEQAISAGASFIVSPHSSEALVKAVSARGFSYIPGTCTPTEIVTAWNWGCPMIKLFPIVTLGTAFLRQLRGPLPDIPLLVTGGITLENALDYRRAGATAIGMGSELLRRWKAGDAQEHQQLLRQVARLIVDLEQI